MEITLKTERPTLKVHVGDDTIEVPLTFTRSEYAEMAQAEDGSEAMFGFLKKYLGDIFDAIGDDDLVALVGAWRDAREEIGAPDMGEASASPES